MYAIIATGGKQYKVSEGDIITIEKLGKEAGEKVTFDQVLAVSDNGIKVGSDVDRRLHRLRSRRSTLNPGRLL